MYKGSTGLLLGSIFTLTLALTLVLTQGCSGSQPPTTEDFDQEQFAAVMNALADAWNRGESRAAADLFTEDAIYSEPPNRQLYQGREALFEFFGGDTGRPGAMSMRWHHLAYNAETGIGLGEFSFTYGSTVHGATVVRIEDGKIARWREYFHASELAWDEFTAANAF